ncbi:MAG: EamA family transporter [bacterium]|nr:EamA family transporter [Acidimicrobiia bacterium]MCY4650136.1 EamA family transporter [bacterium]
MGAGRLEEGKTGLSFVRPQARKGTLLAVVVVLLFGYFAVVVIDLLDYHRPIELAQRHQLIAGAVLLVAAFRKGRLNPRGSLGVLVVTGGLMAVMAILLFIALERLGVGPAITLQFVAVLAVMVWVQLMGGVRVPPIAWMAGLVTMLGISLVVEAWSWERADLIGIASGVGSALFLAAYFLLVDHLAERLPPLTIATYALWIAALFLSPGAGLGPWDLPIPKWWWLLALGVAGTAIPMLLEVIAIRQAGPGPVGIILLTQPVVGGVAAWIMLGQALSPVQILGIAVSLGGVLLVQIKLAEART